jgi:hypothetical protein
MQWQLDQPLNKATLGRMAGVIHYYTSHAPNKVRARWKQANARMNKRYPNRGSSRYYNNTAFAKNRLTSCSYEPILGT